MKMNVLQKSENKIIEMKARIELNLAEKATESQRRRNIKAITDSREISGIASRN